MPNPDTIAAALETLPALSGRYSTPRVAEGRVSLVLDVSGLSPDARDALDRDIHSLLEQVPGVTDIRVAMTSERQGKIIIAVASGKGGVGKSTVSANLAIALAQMGHRVGLIDADIYGPSQPRLLGKEGVKPRAEGNKMIPVACDYGITFLSMGQLVAEGQAIAWRGPMAGNALSQMVDADWSGADILVVDMPPGTGDVQLSMIQKHKPAGAVIVSTPQDLALIDAARAIDLFEKANVPVIGLVENMAGYACPHCGEVSDPFGKGGAEAAAARLGLPFLGRIPLALSIRADSDAGKPPATGAGADAQPFKDLAGRVATWIGNRK